MFRVRQLTNRWVGSWKPHHRKSYWSVPVFIAIHLPLLLFLALFFHFLAFFISILSCLLAPFSLVSTLILPPSFILLLSLIFLLLIPFILSYPRSLFFRVLLSLSLFSVIQSISLSLPLNQVFFSSHFLKMKVCNWWLHTSSTSTCLIYEWGCFLSENVCKMRENRPHSSTQTCVNKQVFSKASKKSTEMYVCTDVKWQFLVLLNGYWTLSFGFFHNCRSNVILLDCDAFQCKWIYQQD